MFVKRFIFGFSIKLLQKESSIHFINFRQYCHFYTLQKIINLDNIINDNNEEHNEKWPYIPDHLYRILIIGGSGSGKTNTLLNLINEQKDIDKIYLYAKDLSEPKYEYLIKNRENAGIKHVNDGNAFIECSNTMDDVYKSINDYNPNKRRKILIVFDDMIADIMTNKKF